MAAQRVTQRLLVSSLLLLTGLFCVVGVAVGLLLENYVREQFVSQQKFRAEKMGQQLDVVLDQMNRLSLSILASAHLQKTFSGIPTPASADYFENHPDVRTDVRETLLSFTSLQPLKGRICLLSEGLDLVDLSNGQDTKRFSKQELAVLTADRLRLLGDQAKVFLGPHKEPWSKYGRDVLSLVRVFRNSEEEFGWMEINQELDSLTWIWSNAGAEGPASIALLDRETVLYRSLVGTVPQDQVMTFPVTLDKVPWTLVLYADRREYGGPLGTTLFALVLLGLMGFVLTALVSWRSLKSTTEPILALTRQVRKIHGLGGELEMPHPKAPEEVRILHRAFEDLLVLQRQEHEALLKSQHQELTARMAALQAQLNPHFVFNTLTSISAYGRKSDGQTVHQMCNALSSLLRYTLESATKPASLAEELEQVRDYCLLMSNRFRPLFEFSLEKDGVFDGVLVPRLLLQPLLENAFVHGFADRPGPWSLKVRATRTETHWQVQVEDNGSGITAERYQEVRQSLEAAVSEENSTFFSRDFSKGKLGLVSSFVRFRLLYGPASQFSLRAAEGGGCLITLGGPCVLA